MLCRMTSCCARFNGYLWLSSEGCALRAAEGSTGSHCPHHTPSPARADPLLSPVWPQCHHLHPHGWRVRSIACFDPNRMWICTRREGKPTFLTPLPLLWISMRRSSTSVLLRISHSGMQPGVTKKKSMWPRAAAWNLFVCRAKIHLTGGKMLKVNCYSCHRIEESRIWVLF